MSNTQEELEYLLERCFSYAEKHSKQYISSEFLLLELLKTEEIKNILNKQSIDINQLEKELKLFIHHRLPNQPEATSKTPELSLGIKMVLNNASNLAQKNNQFKIKASHLFLALFSDKHSHAIYFLSKYGIKQTLVENELQQSLKEKQNNSQFEHQSKYCTNLNFQVANNETLLIGRKKELIEIYRILSLKKKNNPILIGESGVGKTAIIEGIAKEIINQEAPSRLHQKKLLILNMPALIAGTKYRGEFEERLDNLLSEIKTEKNIILVLEDIDSLIGAGAISAGSLDAFSLLKPYLSNQHIQVIATTTYRKYKNLLDKEKQFTSRFNPVYIEELTKDETLNILEKVKKQYETFHQVSYPNDILTSIISLSEEYLINRYFPDKALDLMDNIGAQKALTESKSIITVEDIESILKTTIDKKKESIECDPLVNLESQLKQEVFGQDQIIETISNAIIYAKSGLKETGKPLASFLFVGGTGVGKTELAKQIAQKLGLHFLRYDMSEYAEKHAVSRLIGAPPGYVGFEQGGLLTEELEKYPRSVLLLDEIEKAHTDIHNVLLQAMDYATLTDNNGHKANLKSVILIMTSNSGAFDLYQEPIGFKSNEQTLKSLKNIEKDFSPEFRNRLTSILLFNSLKKETVELIIQKEFKALQLRASKQNLHLNFTPRLSEYILNQNHNYKNGARQLKNIIETEVAVPLAKFILEKKPNTKQLKIITLDYNKNLLITEQSSNSKSLTIH